MKDRSKIMMTQDNLPFQYEIEKSEFGLTSFAGLPLYMEMARVSGLCSSIAEKLKAKQRGWTDLQIVMSLILLNIVGGDCIEDIERLEADEGMRTLLLNIETHGMKRRARRAYEKRWRRTKERAFPSVSALRRYLELFHNANEEQLRLSGKAFIPSSNDLLKSLFEVNRALLGFAQTKNPCKTATLDQDATLVETNKRSAYYGYKKFKAYQPFNTYWYEQGLLLHSEFRDGNVNAGYEQLRLLKASLSGLPDGVEKVYLRSDSAGYQQDVLSYCAEGKDERFGVIEFAIAARVTKEFKQAVLSLEARAWQAIEKIDGEGNRLETAQEFAEVCFVPNFAAKSKKAPSYRYIAIREKFIEQTELEGIESKTLDLPFQTQIIEGKKYKLFGVVTNREVPGNELIQWHRDRCGRSEKVHSVEKSDLAGGKLPSDKFGANAAWWQIMILSFNLNEIMKGLALPETLANKRMKAIRFHIIGVAGRFIHHARQLILKLSGGADIFAMFEKIRHRIMELGQGPPILTT